jgi:hypothetical protein
MKVARNYLLPISDFWELEAREYYTRIYNRRMYERREANEEDVSKEDGYRW